MATDWKGAPKDPQDVEAYGYDWTADIAEGATITTSVWTLADGDVVIGASSIVGGVVTVILSGGTVAASPSILNNHIVMSDGLELDIDISLVIKERKA